MIQQKVIISRKVRGIHWNNGY